MGAASWVKWTGSFTGGGRAAIHTFHNHADSTQTVDRGLAIFGDVSDMLYTSGTQTNFVRFISASTSPIASGSVKNSDASDIKSDYRIKIAIGDEQNSTTLYIPAYDTVV